jgi:hypothetical protein
MLTTINSCHKKKYIYIIINFYAPRHIVIEPSVRLFICLYEVNLERQVGFFLSSTCTNGFIIYTLTNPYNVYDLGKFHNYGFHFHLVMALSALRKWIMVNLNLQVGNILCSIWTNGFMIFTLTYQYNVHDIAKLCECAIHFPINFLSLWK